MTHKTVLEVVLVGPKGGFLAGGESKVSRVKAFTFTKNPINIIMRIEDDK